MGIASIPMVFHLPTVHKFNELFVTADVADAKDLETCLEVGSWAWNWMEPPLGTLSFALLAMQAVRAQMVNMDWRPYSEWVRNLRARRLKAAYPQYNADILEEYAASASLGE